MSLCVVVLLQVLLEINDQHHLSSIYAVVLTGQVKIDDNVVIVYCV